MSPEIWRTDVTWTELGLVAVYLLIMVLLILRNKRKSPNSKK